jgi:L-ascorbate metabolism protein UlaG (beta-lactamase superfamily)
MDPIPPSYGFSGPPLEGVDVITISHEHPDHTNLKVAAGSPLVLRGLSGGDWVQLDRRVKEVAIRTVGVYHDDKQGSQRGKVSAFVFTTDGLHIVHLGDLGHVLTPEQVAALGPVDVLLIPVGGFYTIDASQATEVVSQLSPRVVIPMHYKTPVLRPDWPGVGVEPFLKGKTVQRPGSTTYTFSKETLPRQTTVVVLEYQ